jgi:hypothetical protein
LESLPVYRQIKRSALEAQPGTYVALQQGSRAAMCPAMK